MSVDNEKELLAVIEFVKATKLKGTVEIISDYEFLWDLDGIFLRFFVDNNETTVSYSRRKSLLFEIGHFHEDNCNVINLIQDINNENKRVHICTFLGSSFCVEDKLKKKKKSFLFIRHYYSEL